MLDFFIIIIYKLPYISSFFKWSFKDNLSFKSSIVISELLIGVFKSCDTVASKLSLYASNSYKCLILNILSVVSVNISITIYFPFQIQPYAYTS